MKAISHQLNWLRLTVLLGLAQPLAAGAVTFTVIHTNDTGVGSLRMAIFENNATLGSTNLIQFNIPGAGVQTIRPLTDLPAIMVPVIIDGFTQPGATGNTLAVGNNAVLKIRIDGSAASAISGLTIKAAGCVVRGLVVVNCGNAGISVESGAGSAIEGSFIGLEADGITAAGNDRGIQIVTAHSVRVGGGTPGARNIISGNMGGITMGWSSGSRIQGNYIGTGASGLFARANRNVGIHAGQVDFIVIGGTNALERNVISANGSEAFGYGGGVYLLGNSNTIQGNFIGLYASGTARLGNFQNGLTIEGGTNNLVGGSLPGAGNVISGNQYYGLFLLYDTAGQIVQGNRIGTSADGLTAIGNQTGVIVIGGNDLGVVIGGTNPGEGNQISGNSQHGIELLQGSDVRVQGNQIGTDATGLGALGNGQNGINLDSSGHIVGGTNVGEANVLAFNANSGVGVGGSSGNRILGNSIHSNGRMGIDLYPYAGPTLNDAGDGDTGGNDLQNFPVLLQAARLPTGILVRGTLNSQPDRVYRLDFYGNAVCHSSGYGEGRTWLGTSNVTTDGEGDVAFTSLLSLSTGVAFITATATSTNGSTSEFSACQALNTNGVVDLILTRTISTNLIISGQPFAYTLTLSNAGPDTATGAGMSFSFPGEMTILNATVSQGSIGEDGWLYISFGTIPPGGSATLTVTALPTASGTFSDSSSAYSAQYDLSPENNSLTATVTVLDGPGLFKLSSSMLTVHENTGMAIILVTRGGGAVGEVSVDYATSNITAEAGTDFTAVNGTLVFTNGEVTRTFAVNIHNDSVSQCNRELLITLSNPTGGAALGDPATARLLIVEDDIVRVGNVEAASLEVNPPSRDRLASGPAVDAQGRFVAFSVRSYDWPGFGDMYLRNVTNHTTTLISANTNGEPAYYAAGVPHLSDDGRFAAFYSGAPDMVAGDANNNWDVFVRDMLAGRTRLVSVTSSGSGSGNGASYPDDMTPDGRFVAFESGASNLVSSDTNGHSDVFLRDLVDDATELISAKSSGQGSGNGHSFGSRVSADGRYVAFTSLASDLNGADTNNKSDAYVRDRFAGTNILCSINTNQVAGNDDSYVHGLSANGHVVVFNTRASDLVVGANSSDNIFAFDVPTRTLQLVTANLMGDPANDFSFGEVLSADGRYVAFSSYADDLVADDHNNETDVFVRDLVAGTTTLVSVNCQGTDSGNGRSVSPSISADGRFVTFESQATDLVAGALNPYNQQTFRRDLLTGTTLLLSFNHDTGMAGHYYSYDPVISADGNTVAFASWSTNLVGNDSHENPDIYVWRAPAAGPAGTNAAITALRMIDGRPTLDVLGNPGTLYLIQRTTNLTQPILWTLLATTNAPQDGLFEFIDTTPPPGSAFYRVAQP